MTVNVNDMHAESGDPFTDAAPEDRWHYGAVGAYYDIAENYVWAVVEQRDSAADDFELLLMQLRDRFPGVYPGTPVWDEEEHAWLYRITVKLGEAWPPRRRSTLAYLGFPQGEHHEFATAGVILNHETGTAYIVADILCSHEDWERVLEVLRSSGWFTGDPIHDDIGEPFHNIPTDAWFWIFTR
jgi:hypothetical protein